MLIRILLLVSSGPGSGYGGFGSGSYYRYIFSRRDRRTYKGRKFCQLRLYKAFNSKKYGAVFVKVNIMKKIKFKR